MRASEVANKYKMSKSTVISRLKKSKIDFEMKSNHYVIEQKHLEYILSYKKIEKRISNKTEMLIIDFKLTYPMLNNDEIASSLIISQKTVDKVINEKKGFYILKSKINGK